jgi:hypothetical protein
LLGPNGPHFRQGIAFDHWARIKPPMSDRANTGMRGSAILAGRIYGCLVKYSRTAISHEPEGDAPGSSSR